MRVTQDFHSIVYGQWLLGRVFPALFERTKRLCFVGLFVPPQRERRWVVRWDGGHAVAVVFRVRNERLSFFFQLPLPLPANHFRPRNALKFHLVTCQKKRIWSQMWRTNRCRQSRTSEETVPKSSPMGSILELANNMRNSFSPCGIHSSRSLGSNEPLVAGLPLGTAQIRKNPTMWSMRYKWKYCCASDNRTYGSSVSSKTFKIKICLPSTICTRPSPSRANYRSAVPSLVRWHCTYREEHQHCTPIWTDSCSSTRPRYLCLPKMAHLLLSTCHFGLRGHELATFVDGTRIAKIRKTGSRP